MGKLRIISRSGEPFDDRVEAGRILGKEMVKFRGQNAVVLGIPRGGVIVARELASALQADLDILISRKLGAPGNPELAIGALSEEGKLYLNESIIWELEVDKQYIEMVKKEQMREIERRVAMFRKVLPKIPLEDRLVIVTDDGVATGASMQAALWDLRERHPKQLIGALPVGPQESLAKLAEYADEVICLRAPSGFMSVGQFYQDFDQVTDDEVLEVLKMESQRREEKWQQSQEREGMESGLSK